MRSDIVGFFRRLSWVLGRQVAWVGVFDSSNPVQSAPNCARDLN